MIPPVRHGTRPGFRRLGGQTGPVPRTTTPPPDRTPVPTPAVPCPPAARARRSPR
ncbi:hypothetical protein SUDANB178_04218 [Streptomyces sp. enrichment culture]